MKTTTIRITEEQHAWILANRPNQLSSICRQHLDELIHSETPVSFHNAWREAAQKCYPFMRGGYCSLCWPAGTPPRQHWMDFIKENGVGAARSITFDEWSAAKWSTRQSALTDWNGTEMGESAPAASTSWERIRKWMGFTPHSRS